jgi:hypothetical protein
LAHMFHYVLPYSWPFHEAVYKPFFVVQTPLFVLHETLWVARTCSSLGNPYPSRVFLPFFVFHTKNHATYFTQPKITFRIINFCLKKILYCFRSYLVATWFSHTLLTTVLCSLSQQNLCCV